ncbi:hypothetical protein P5673_019062 [Acropora cervicornis]|uniref:Uncharacterized protein n=1 Tax=Acropora cervicornis TaxID=6130 RepID=A0AAD9QBY0_ACRCE|nr:hypothetical protein P5673_019062 [Acropora cervicornis]
MTAVFCRDSGFQGAVKRDATIRDELFREFSTLLVSFAGGLIGDRLDLDLDLILADLILDAAKLR